MEKMQNLRLIGYTKSHVVRPYELLATGMNVAILLLAMIIVVVVRIKYIAVVQTVWVDFAGAGIFSSIVTGVAVFCLLSLLNILVIRGKVD